jgi:serine/threonine-protein kinase
MTDELIGRRVGGYEILGVVGRGGMATVYRAHQLSMNRQVALKVLPRQFMNDDTYLQRFEREVRIISQLEHRNIVPVYEYGEFEGQPYIAMRYMSGGSVDDLLNNGALSLEQITGVMTQIAPALDYAHGKGVLHRDIKPSNVLLDDDGGAYLTDFGIARIIGDSSAVNPITTQGVVGTPSYMSPEQAQGHPIDGRSDVYSLGVMLFEMATGRRPFESDTPYSIAVMQVTQPPPAPRSINPNITGAVEQVIYKAMSKRREDRYPDAVAFADALEAINGGAIPVVNFDTYPGIAAASPRQPASPTPSSNPAVLQSTSAPLAPPRPRRRARPNLMVSAAVGVLLGCGLLAALLAIALVVINNTREEEARLLQTLTVTTAQISGQTVTVAPMVTPLPGIQDGEPRATQPGEPTFTPMGEVPLLTFAADNALPGAEILYFAERDGNFDLYRLNLRTGAEVRMTTHPGVDMYPQVSPDGQTIVFVSSRDGDFDLYLMNVNGDNVRQLTRNNLTDRIPAWSPDGRWIVFSSDVRGDGSHDIYQIRPDGSDLSLVYSNGLRNSHPRWSSDDQYLLFTTGMVSDETTWDILRLNRRTEEVLALTDNTTKDSSAVFTPNGGQILFIADGEGGGAIAEMNLDGSDKRVIYDGPGEEWGATYSPDLRYLLFTSNPNPEQIDQLFLLSLESGEVRQLTFNAGMYGSWFNYNVG